MGVMGAVDKLIHTSEGNLVSENPFRTLGTKLKYIAPFERERIGIVTEAALQRAEDDGDTDKVWAEWRDINTPYSGSSDPSWLERKNPTLEVVEW